MSEASEQASQSFDRESALAALRDYYHVPVLFAVLAFMLWVRVKNWERFVVDGKVLFSGNDAWYHLRTVQYTVQHWPNTMPFDPWTHFPYGTASGQFGTFFDQVIATVALIVGLGSPTDHQVRLVHLFAPAIFGTLTAIPVYYLGKKVASRAGALVGLLVLGLSTGQFLTRSVAGFSDHHVAEVFFLSLALTGIVYAIGVVREDAPIWELFAEQAWDDLRRSVLWSAGAGVLLSLYLWTWPPGVFVLGILGIFYTIAMAYYQATGTSPEPLAVSGAIIGIVVGVMTLAVINTFEFTAVAPSLLQPTLAFGLAAGCAFLAGLARVWDERDVEPLYYPATIAAIFVVGGALFSVVLPDLFGYFVSQTLRVFGHAATAASRTVAEAQPVSLGNIGSYFFGNYGLAFYLAILSFALLIYRIGIRKQARADHIFLLVISVFLFLAAITQKRFDYYFTIPVAVLNAYLATFVFQWIDLDDVRDPLEDIEGYQVMAVLSIILLVAAPLTVGARTAPAMTDATARPGGVQQWTGSLDWMQNNTPEEGYYGGASNDLAYYGTFQQTENFEYEDGQYGVMSWWDYGHWITVIGKRIPVANPFQQNAQTAANFLLAPNETTANQYMTSESGEQTRYVMIDYQLGVAGTRKFSAPTAFESEYGLSAFGKDGVTRPILNPNTGEVRLTLHTPRSYESIRVRLYQGNGGRMEPGEGRMPVFVFDYDTRTIRGQSYAFAPKQGFVKQFRNYSAARQFVQREGSAQVGGIANLPSKPIPALEHYRLVHASETVRRTRLGGTLPVVKTFERVPGATIKGTGPANTTVVARVPMKMYSPNKTFIYEQQVKTGPDGKFTMTVPYSTTGYENWGTEKGYTNVSVRALGPYQFQTPRTMNESQYVYHYRASANVTEAQVIGEDDSPVRVTLERTVDRVPPSARNGTNSSSLRWPSAIYARA